MFDNLTGSSFFKKPKLSSSVADLPKSMNCWMVSGEGLNWEKWSRVFRDFWSNNLLKLRVTAVSLILKVLSVLAPPSYTPFLLSSQVQSTQSPRGAIWNRLHVYRVNYRGSVLQDSQMSPITIAHHLWFVQSHSILKGRVDRDYCCVSRCCFKSAEGRLFKKCKR